jgi:hypothetical protein
MTSFIRIMHLLRTDKYLSMNDIGYLATHWLFDDRWAKRLRRYARFAAYINHDKIIFAHNH